MTKLFVYSLAKEFVYAFGMTENGMVHPREGQTNNSSSKERRVDGNILPHPVYIPTTQGVDSDEYKGKHTWNEYKLTG